MNQAGDLAARIIPVMIFLAAITVVAEIAQIAGVFDVAGRFAARHARQRVWLLWCQVAVLSCLVTIVLSLDTTAVLLTPVVLAIARQIRVPVVPFALTTVLLANTASLLLPVSNLTNLLALHHFAGYGAYLRVAWAPALAAIAVTVALVWLLHRRALRGTFALEPLAPPHDPVLLRTCGVICLLIGPAFITGVTPAVPATIAALAMLALMGWRRRDDIRSIQVPWRMIVAVCALFVLIDLAGRHGLTSLLQYAVGRGTSLTDLLRLSTGAAIGSNAVNNLPTYLALEPPAGGNPIRLMTLLIGTNTAPLVTAWGSMATLLWRNRCRRAGITVRGFYAQSTLVAVTCLVCATLTLHAVAG